MNKQIIRQALLLLSIVLSVSPAARADLATDLYQQAVHILGGNANVISRWEDEIRFAVLNDNGPAFATDVAKAVVSEAAGIANVPIRFPEHRFSVKNYLTRVQQTRPYLLSASCGGAADGCFNFVVMIAGPETMLALAEAIPLRQVYQQALRESPDLACFFAPHHYGRQQILQSVVYVNQGLNDAMLRTCLQEEIYQSFGLYNDASGSTLFSFNNVVAPKQITRYDKALLKALYDPEVKPGFPVDFVVRIFLQNLDL